MLTFGFYDSINHDRKYNAEQFSSIFDGVIKDGVFMSIGDCFQVSPAEGMILSVGTGRAWFNHTWTLNSSSFPVNIPESHVLLDRIDAVVIDVNTSKDARRNSIIVVEGTPNSNPVRPSLINSTYRHQYPLAYVLVKAGDTEIRAADITNMVGSSFTPYVTGILETISIDSLVAQWEDQWEVWKDNINSWANDYKGEMDAWSDSYKSDMSSWANDYKGEMDAWANTYTNNYESQMDTWRNNYTKELNSWANDYKGEMDATATEWQNTWNDWFYTYTSQSQQEFSQWMSNKNIELETWFDSLKVVLDGDVASNLTRRVVELESCCGIVKNFMNYLTNEYTIYDDLHDNTDEVIIDSNGNSVMSRTIFITK